MTKPFLFVTTLTCPVCGFVLDEIKHHDAQLNGMSEALLGQPERHKHSKTSPECTKHKDWIKGWNSSTKPITE